MRGGINKMKKIEIKNKSGLTLVEMIIAIAVLSITILASTAVSATYLKSRTSIKKYQANSEELSMAMNYLSKDIRMSNCTDGGCNFLSDSIKIYSNTGSVDTPVPITYAFDAGAETLTRNGAIVASNVRGTFYTTSAAGIARITISLQKDGTPAMAVQTTVSMRNKYKEGI